MPGYDFDHIPSAQPAIADRLGRPRLILVVALKDHGSAHQELAVRRNLELGSPEGFADRSDTHVCETMGEDAAARLRLAVHLDERHADRTKERKNLRRDRRGTCDARP